VAEVELSGWPDITIAGKLSISPGSRLPSQEDAAILWAVEVCPEERGGVARDLGRRHQPFCDLVEIDGGTGSISKCRQQVHMRELDALNVS